MKKFTILIPVYNDWKSVFELLKNSKLKEFKKYFCEKEFCIGNK